ncbi:unnamed protein product [Thlaspi arvense]|uniref:Protein groES n=1 Tax=Thlaspi arvense TaxID=13288 RepID=A0AAU9R4Q1_THLAR|nr:unnamed protein product [Thlaspi arvense]
MAKRLIPTLNRVLVEKILQPSKTVSGILLPESSSQLNSGRVIAVGPGARDRAGNLIPVSVKEGDNVLLPEFGGTQVKLGEKEYVLNLFDVIPQRVSFVLPQLISLRVTEKQFGSSDPRIETLSITVLEI